MQFGQAFADILLEETGLQYGEVRTAYTAHAPNRPRTSADNPERTQE